MTLKRTKEHAFDAFLLGFAIGAAFFHLVNR